MTPEQATAALTAQAVPAYSQPMTIDVHGEPTAIEPAAAGSDSPTSPATIDAVGERSANPFVRLTSFFTSTEVPLSVQVDDAALTAFVADVAAQTDLQPVEGEVAIDGVTVRTVEPVIGRTLHVPEAVTAISDAWTGGGPTALEGLVLPVTAHPVRATPEKVAGSGRRGDRASCPRRCASPGPEPAVEVAVADIAAATTITADERGRLHRSTVDAAALRVPVTGASRRPRRAPVDAGDLDRQDGTSVITPSVPGRTVDWAATEAPSSRRFARPTQAADRLHRDRARVDHREDAGPGHQGGHRRVHHRRLRRRVRREHQGRRREGERRDRAARRDVRAERVHRNPGHRPGLRSGRDHPGGCAVAPRSAAGSASSPPPCTTRRTSPGWATSPTPRTRSTSAATRRAGRRRCSTARSNWPSPTTTRPAC